MEVSIHELLAAAREAVKSDYIKGESILCETRYHPDTHYMVEIEMLKTDNMLGKKGAYIRKFLTQDEYSAMLQKQEEHLIKIKRQAIVQKGTLRYIPLPDRLDSHRERDIFNRLGKNRECSSSSSGMRTPEFPQVLGRKNLEKCSKQALLQRSVAAEKGFLALCQTKK